MLLIHHCGEDGKMQKLSPHYFLGTKSQPNTPQIKVVREITFLSINFSKYLLKLSSIYRIYRGFSLYVCVCIYIYMLYICFIYMYMRLYIYIYIIIYICNF